MRSNLLLLGMLIPVAIAVAYYGGTSGDSGPSSMDRLYASNGARVVTGDLDDMLSGAALAAGGEDLDIAAPSTSDAFGVAGDSDAAASPESVSSWLEFLNDWLPSPARSEPLLVILVSGKERLAIARKGVRDDRISGESDEAFVVDGSRMVAANRDAAASLIMTFGWIDRPIELLSVAPKKTPAPRQRSRRNSDAVAFAPLDSVAAEVAAVRGSDQARVQAAIETVRGATQ